MKKILFFLVLLTISISFNAQTSNTLKAGQTLMAGQKLISANAKYMLLLQANDGNLCVYQNNNGNKGSFVWCSMKYGFQNAKLVLQADGNLVVYDANNTKKWASNTVPSADEMFRDSKLKPVKLQLENDGTFALYAKNGLKVWSNKPPTPYNKTAILIIDKLWKRGTASVIFKKNYDLIINGEKSGTWSWFDQNKLIMEIKSSSFPYYYRFKSVKSKSLIMQVSTSSPQENKWVFNQIYTTN